jgi:hypothetical protein
MAKSNPPGSSPEVTEHAIPAASHPQQNPHATDTSEHFKLVLGIAVAITFLSGTTSLVLTVAMKNPSREVLNNIEMFSTAFKTGFGAIIGLLGGSKAKH